MRCFEGVSIRRRTFLGALGAVSAAFATSAPAFAQSPPQAQTVDLGNQGALYRFQVNAGFGGIFFTVAALPRHSFAAGIVEQHDRAGALTAVRDIGRSSGATVAINGGRFNGAFAPDGLLIVDGKTAGEKRSDWMGYLVIDGNGSASVTTSPNLRHARYAVQGNPTIVEPGGKMGIVREDSMRARRTVIAQSGDVILAIVTSPVSLFDLGYALIERPDLFFVNRIDAALNLSGGATTAFYARLPGGESVDVPAYWPNRDVITFVPRSVKA